MSKWFRFLSGKQEVRPSSFRLPFSQDRFLEVVRQIESSELTERGESFPKGLAAEVAPRLLPLSSLFKGPRFLVTLGTREGATVQGREGSLPLVSASLDLVLLRVYQGRKQTSLLLKEASRVLREKGRLVLVDLHPFSPMVQEEYRGQAVTEEGPPPGFERYFKGVGLDRWVVEGVREIFFDNSWKKFFRENEMDQMDQLRRRPCLLILTLRRESLRHVD
ncbi:MAG: hypothetical protein HY542_00295 [Deltaproteobacteria bacterium]|nr:hypothetical protein [Deltaproteobacteria bacterium]